MIVGVRYQCGHCPTSPSFNLVCLEKGCLKILIDFIFFSVPIAKSGHTIITILHMSFSNFQDLWTDLWNHHRLYCRPCKRTFFYVIPSFCSKFFYPSYQLPAGPPANALMINDPRGDPFIFLLLFRGISF